MDGTDPDDGLGGDGLGLVPGGVQVALAVKSWGMDSRAKAAMFWTGVPLAVKHK